MADNRKVDSERELFGNGTLTVAARLSAVVMPFLMALVLWLGKEVWTDIKILKQDRLDVTRIMAGMSAKLDEHSRWNATQDARIERLLDERRNSNGSPR